MEMALAPRSAMDIESPISFGESPWSEVVPMPSCPFELSPQQATSALSRRAQVKSSPAVICTAVLPVGRETCTRLSPIPPGWSPTDAVEPMPSCPWELSPQQDTVPFEKRRQVWSQPSAMDAGEEVLVE